uniref:Uncharacterized protein n=1 Tax=Nelumbo nucifera TaxID=4432 RepID=A0A822Y9T6_NELNU|nr:TPA_asm: hypothetical protein HUJ06_030550 [Nelumbo nucifera]
MGANLGGDLFPVMGILLHYHRFLMGTRSQVHQNVLSSHQRFSSLQFFKEPCGHINWHSFSASYLALRFTWPQESKQSQCSRVLGTSFPTSVHGC